MTKQKLFKYQCPKYSYSKTVRSKSDVINPADFMNICPKCNTPMGKTSLSTTENLLGKLFGK